MSKPLSCTASLICKPRARTFPTLPTLVEEKIIARPRFSFVLEFLVTNHNMADKWVELSDEQIEQLLSEAETRLSTQANNGKKGLSKPSKSDVVQTDASQAVALKAPQPSASASETKSKEKLSVRIPEVRKGKNEKVCRVPYFPMSSHSRFLV